MSAGTWLLSTASSRSLLSRRLLARRSVRCVWVAPRARRVAVVLNANARGVDKETIRWVETVVPRADLFVSRRIEDAPVIAERILALVFDAILWGGGDGTFALGGAQIEIAARRAGRAHLPEMGVLRLGTGNALADAVGASTATPIGLSDDLRRARSAPSARSLPLLDVEGRPSLFCGFGLDAMILDDFGATVEMLKRSGLADKVKSAALRYGLSVTTRTLGRFFTEERPEVVAINRGAPAIKVDVDGNPVGAPIETGRVLWRGVATLASAATIPFYGLGMRIFPHSDRMAGRFQLRLSDAGTAEMLLNLPKIWKGRFSSPRVHDFLVDDVEIVLSRPAPMQANGDLVGTRERVRLAFWDRPISVV